MIKLETLKLKPNNNLPFSDPESLIIHSFLRFSKTNYEKYKSRR